MNKYCPECGNKCSGSKFCSECGYNLVGASNPARPSIANQAPEIDYEKFTFKYKVDAESTTKKFGEVAQESKTGFIRDKGTLTKQDALDMLKRTASKIEVGGGDDE